MLFSSLEEANERCQVYTYMTPSPLSIGRDQRLAQDHLRILGLLDEISFGVERGSLRRDLVVPFTKMHRTRRNVILVTDQLRDPWCGRAGRRQIQ